MMKHRCFCNVTGRWYTPRRVVRGQGACLYCDAHRVAYDEPDYNRAEPQWHPLLSTLAEAEVRLRQKEEACAIS